MFISWALKTEFTILGLFSFFWIAEDWFWFLENDYYGLRNFKKGRIFWHKRWLFGLPVSYVYGMIIGIIFLLLGR
jgi:hypothetical protein